MPANAADAGLILHLGREEPLRKEMATRSSILPGKFHGQRRLMGYSPWGRKESDTTERLTLTLWKHAVVLGCNQAAPENALAVQG